MEKRGEKSGEKCKSEGVEMHNEMMVRGERRKDKFKRYEEDGGRMDIEGHERTRYEGCSHYLKE